MNALITGGAGFIGSHLAEAILDARASRVVVLDDLSTGSRANLAALAGRSDFELVEGDVCDQGVVAPLVDRCEVVFHLAAAVGVRLIAECPIHTIKTNVNGTETVLAEAARHGRTVIVASTSEVYGKNNRPPFAEGDDTTLGSTQSMRWSYACSKLTDEFLALAYHQQRDLPVVICRLFNTIGPRQQGRYGMVVPRFIRQALDDAPLEVYGTGRQTRCFCHVADTVRALLLLASCPEAVGQVVNVGSDESVSIRQLAECIVEMTGSRSDIRAISYEQAYGRWIEDMQVRAPDLKKIRALTGYEPTYTLRKTLEAVIAHACGQAATAQQDRSERRP